MNFEMLESIRSTLLKSNEYTYDNKEDYKFTYERPNFWISRKMNKKFHLSDIPYGKNEFTHMTNILKHTFDIMDVGVEKDAQNPDNNFNCFGIYDIVRKHEKRGNCWMISTMLTEFYLYFGYKAKTVRCMKCDGFNVTECHCVTMVYSNQFKKWIVMDAPNRCYYLGKDMVPLHILEIKEHFLENKKIIIPLMNLTDARGLLDYFSTHLYYFQFYANSSYNIESSPKHKIRYTLHSVNEFHSTTVRNSSNGGTIEERYTTDAAFFMKEPED